MSAVLNISPGLSLPLDAVTETFGILAKRGKGKTNTGVVLFEELVGAGLPVVAIDPVGVWWGLRSNAGGNGPGLPVVILGGDHGDLPLEPAAGALVADTLVGSRAPMVLDLSVMSKTQARRFVTDFTEQLYHRNRDPLHVIVDEADLFAPQRATADSARMLGAMEDLVRRGRARGIGVTLISQRPAAVHKDVLTQVEALVVLGMTGPRDVAAIDEWVSLHATEEEAHAVKASLPSLPVGTAWVWSPGWLGLLERVEVRARSTFDSSATPKPGVARPTAAAFAPVDVASLGEQMRVMAAEVLSRDPARLQARIRQLEGRLAELEAAPVNPELVPVVPDEVWALVEAASGVIQAVERTRAALAEVDLPDVEGAAAALRATAKATSVPRAQERQPAPTRVTPAPTPTREGGSGPATLGKAPRRVLEVLAVHGNRTTDAVAVLTGYAAKSGNYRNALSTLRAQGLIVGRGEVSITASGMAMVGQAPALPHGDALRAYWKAHSAVPGASGKVLDVLARHYPDAVSTVDIAAETGYEPSSGNFRNALSRLRSLGLASGRGELLINPELVG